MRVEQQIEYEAKSDAEAIQTARERLGRDAVILSTRPVKLGGVLGFFRRDALWVTAGILVPDEEDAKKETRERMLAFQHLLDVRRAVAGNHDEVQSLETNLSDNVANSAFAPPAGTVSATVAAKAYESNSAAKGDSPALAKDVGELKSILNKVLERLDGERKESETGDLTPLHDENARILVEVDVDRDIALDIVDEYNAAGTNADFQEWLAGQVPVMGISPSMALGGKKVLFAGPTGVGKTTTIAKIAATQSLWENQKVVLLTADTYRIAAVEQLRTYAKILGIPMEVAADVGEIEAALGKHKDADLILLDTAGRSHYDGERIDELRLLYDAFKPDAVHLVMAANIKYRDMLNVIDRMGVVPISALLFTKLDETSDYGTILNVLRDFDLPASFFTTGQNVPNDIEVARGERLTELLFERATVRKDAR